MSKGERKENAKYKLKWYVYITYEKVQWNDHVIHPITEYIILTLVII